MKTLLFVPVLIILALIRAVSHTAEFVWPVRPVQAVANWSARILKELLINDKEKKQSVLGTVTPSR